MTEVPSKSHSSGTAAQKFVAVVLVAGWFALPVVYLWGAWELLSFEPNLEPVTDHETAAKLAIALSGVLIVAAPLAAWRLARHAERLRTVAKVQVGVGCAAVLLFAIGAL